MRTKYTLRELIIAVLMLGLVSAAVAAPPGQLIDIGGRLLHVIEHSGDGPSIVLEAGGGAYSSFWYQVQQSISSELGMHVISYDRAGLGWSQRSSSNYDLNEKAEDLDVLLSTMGIDTPIILVATSYGAWVAQVFAARYPDKIAALVLVEPNSTYFFEQFPKKVQKIEADGNAGPGRGLRRFGLRLKRNWLAKHIGVPRRYFEPILSSTHQTALADMLAAFGETMKSLSGVTLPDVPTILISRGKPQKGFPWGDRDSEREWRTGHERLIAHLSIKEHWIADESSHGVVFSEPQIVVDAIAAVAAKLRSH